MFANRSNMSTRLCPDGTSVSFVSWVKLNVAFTVEENEELKKIALMSDW